MSGRKRADAIIARAGMGSILTALALGKPIVVMPRRAHLGERRSNHPWTTMNHLGEGVEIVRAADESQLVCFLERLEEQRSPTERPSEKYARLLNFLHGTLRTLQ